MPWKNISTAKLSLAYQNKNRPVDTALAVARRELVWIYTLRYLQR